jgi:hypothetical protein
MGRFITEGHDESFKGRFFSFDNVGLFLFCCEAFDTNELFLV